MLKVFPVHTNEPEQRLGSMSASDAVHLLKAYTYYTEDADSPNGRGYQRPPTENRFPAIAADLVVHGVTPIIISDRSRWASLFRDASSTVEMSVEEAIQAIEAAGVDGEKSASVLDGQHRFRAAILAWMQKGVDLSIPFLLFTNLTWPEEVDRFNVINTTAKNLPRALVEVNRHTTFVPDGASNRDIQRQEVRDVVMALETDPESVWHEQVNMTGGRNTDRPVTFEGLRRSSEATFGGRLALLPVETKIKLAKTYWRVVAETWPEAWNDTPIAVETVNPATGDIETEERAVKYRLKDLAGVSALAKVGNQILLDAYDDETGNINIGVVRGRLARAKDVNWVKASDNPDMNAQAGFAGLADMYDMLLQRVYGASAPSTSAVA